MKEVRLIELYIYKRVWRSKGITPPRYFPKKQHGIRAVVLLGGGERKGRLVLVVVAGGDSVEQKDRGVECCCGGVEPAARVCTASLQRSIVVVKGAAACGLQGSKEKQGSCGCSERW
jgi:hypothetical protein